MITRIKVTSGVVIDHEADWPEFRKWIDGTYASLSFTWVDEGAAYAIAALDGSFTRMAGINKDSNEYQTDFEANFKHNRAVLIPVSGVVQQAPLLGRRLDIYTSDFTKRESWWQDSARVTNETLTDSGDHTTYTPATSRYWVDVMHGKLFREWELHEDYAPVVKVDNVAKTENSAGTTNGDYSVNYATGAVTFNSALTGSEVVTASYSYVQSSLFKAQAPAGYLWTSATVKVIYSEDMGMKDSIYFQLWGNVGYGMMALSTPEIYQSLDDLKKDASRIEYESFIATGSSGAENAWRMPTKKRIFLYYDYRDRAATQLQGAYQMEIRCWLETDTPFVGEMGCASFFGRKDAE